MKVVHIATSDYGGAALGMLNLHHALLKVGVDSKVLVSEKFTEDDTVVQMQPNYDQFVYSKNIIIRNIQKYLRKRSHFLSNRERYDRKTANVPSEFKSSCFTSPLSQYNVLWNPLVRQADVIHLHWIGDFLDFPSFFLEVDKPVVWTLRDENPGLGGFHYQKEKQLLYDHYREIEDFYISVKRNSIGKSKCLTLINLSDVMMQYCRGVDFLSNLPSFKIYNAIDVSRNNMIDRSIARRALGLADDRFVVSFVSVILSDYRKNLDKVVSAIDCINSDWSLLCVGHAGSFKNKDSRILCYGAIADPQLMSIVYSASDVFLTPSMQESFGKTTVEALLCGIPVISSKTGIAPEILNDSNGILLDEITEKNIYDALVTIRSKHYDRKTIRNSVIELFSAEKIAQEHIFVYNSVLHMSE